MAKGDWRTLEELVANIQRGLAPSAIVEHNVHVTGRITGAKRQIDVLVTQMVGQYEMRIVIDCKATKRPADTKCVGEFAELVYDTGASKGVLVCPAGFSVSAKKTAKHHQIELYQPVDTGDHKWKVRATLPALCSIRRGGLSFGVRTTAPMPFTISQHPATFETFDIEGNRLGTPLMAAVARWKKGLLPNTPGVHERCAIFDHETVFVDNGHGARIAVELFVGILVTEKLYFGQVPIDQISGFLDAQTGSVIANSFTTGLLSGDQVQSSWQLVESIDGLPVKPVLTLMGLECWSDDAEMPPFP